MTDFKKVFEKMYEEIYEYVNLSPDKCVWFGGNFVEAPFYLSEFGDIDKDFFHITALKIENNKLMCFVDYTTDAELWNENEFWEYVEDTDDDQLKNQWKRVNDILTITSIHCFLEVLEEKDKPCVPTPKDNKKEEKPNNILNNDFDIIL